MSAVYVRAQVFPVLLHPLEQSRLINGGTSQLSLRCTSRCAALATDPPVFPRLAKETLCEIEPFLCFCQILLDVLDTTFKCLEPRSDLG